MKKVGVSQVWELEKIFPGGSSSSEFMEFLTNVETEVNQFEHTINTYSTPQQIYDAKKLDLIVTDVANIQINLSQSKSFITCLLAQNPKDERALILKEKITIINSNFESNFKQMQITLGRTEQSVWDKLIKTKTLEKYKYNLDEWYEESQTYLSSGEENLISSLMVDGYHAWRNVYNSLINHIKIQVHADGVENTLSVGQAINLRSHSDETVRFKAHQALEKAWKEHEGLFAKILNHIAGFRLQVYKERGVENVLDVPLTKNRINQETLDTMWKVIKKNKRHFTKYLNQKAKIMQGDAKMHSYNFWVAITDNNQIITYDEAVQFILKQFSQFGTELETFAFEALNNGWIESENRPNKSASAFCAGFPLTGESRIFMTYDGRIANVLTLAHEIGHAFHNYAMKTVDEINRRYPMSLAETASIFSEMIILDKAFENAKTKQEKLFLIDEKLKRSVMNFMNIHSRFLFEERFYEERKKGFVTSNRLNELMKAAIDEGYEGMLDSVSYRSWVWTPHFYITEEPFYNFPYTFGYLFALSIYAKAQFKGRSFEEDYLKLLRDSGSMSTEELVMKHLGEDITTESFWEKGIKLCVKDAEEFIKLTSF